MSDYDKLDRLAKARHLINRKGEMSVELWNDRAQCVLGALFAEVARLQVERDTEADFTNKYINALHATERERDGLRAEVERLTSLIAEAPHAGHRVANVEVCGKGMFRGDYEGQPCTCWKSRSGVIDKRKPVCDYDNVYGEQLAEIGKLSAEVERLKTELERERVSAAAMLNLAASSGQLLDKYNKLTAATRALVEMLDSLASEDDIKELLSCYAISPVFEERRSAVRRVLREIEK